jgi:hypothetical protein
VHGESSVLPAPGAAWWQASREELIAWLQRAEVLRRQAAALEGEVLAEIAGRGVGAEYGYPDLALLLRDVLLIDKGEANRRVARSDACYAVRTGTAESPAQTPQTGQAWREGAISERHVDAITDVLGELPSDVSAEDYAEGEQILLELARHALPGQVRHAGRRLLAHLAPDGSPPKDDEKLAQPERELRLSWRRDGRLGLSGVLDAESGTALQTLLGSLSQRRPTHEGCGMSAPTRSARAMRWPR